MIFSLKLKLCLLQILFIIIEEQKKLIYNLKQTLPKCQKCQSIKRLIHFLFGSILKKQLVGMNEYGIFYKISFCFVNFL